MSVWRDRRFVFPAAAFLAALAYGAVLFNLGPYSIVRERLPAESLPEERFGFKGPELYEFIDGLVIEEDGASQVYIEAYKGFQLFDIPNGALIALFLAALIWALTKSEPKGSALKLLIALPAAMFIFDLVEDIVIIRVIDLWPSRYPGLAAFAGTATWLKMLAGTVTIASVLFLAAARLLFHLRNRSKYAG